MRLITLPEKYNPLVHDILKTATILFVMEIVLFFKTKDPVLDRVFIEQVGYYIGALTIFYLIVDPVIGSGPGPCCSIRDMVKM